jgi:TolA-binding protein
VTRSVANRTEMQQPRGNGSVAGSTDLSVAAPSSYVVDGIGAAAAAQSDIVASLTARLDQLTQDLSESRQRSEQLRATLEKRTRRVQQLIGERDRLTTLLAERDAELQRLNRELGALTAGARPATDGSPGLLKAARAVLDRVRSAREAPRPTGSREAQPSTPQQASPAGALVPWVQNGPPKAVLAVMAFGLSQAEIAQVLAAIEATCAERDLAPLLLTDNDAFQVFRGRRVLFEYLPPSADQERLAPELDWRLYTLRRLALIRRKWQPVRVVAFGSRAAEVVKLWHGSPFETTPVPAALNGSFAGAEFRGHPAQASAR